MYVVATDSRRKDEVLFMVDRNRQRASFWSNCLDDVLIYGDKSSADQKAKKLHFNNARVLTLQAAHKIAKQQEQERNLTAALSESELGWDGHKSYF